MAKSEHFKIIKQGVEAWNLWRKANPDFIPDLSDENLDDMHLNGIDFTHANLTRTSFCYASLLKATFSFAVLSSTNFTGAKLNHSDFAHARLRDAKLIGAKLVAADFRFANLFDVDLTGANLSQVNLNYANLKGSRIVQTRLSQADLRNCNLFGIECRNADFEGANLTGIILDKTDAFIWNIHQVQCKHIYLDPERRQRYPVDRDFEPGEFERLYGSKAVIEFVCQKGMKWFDALVLDWLVSKIHVEKPELGLELLSLDKKGSHLKATFVIASAQLKAEAEKEVEIQYEKAVQMLESQNQYLINGFFEFLLHALQKPRKQKIKDSDSDFQMNKMTITQAIEEIKRAVNKEPEISFNSEEKKKILLTLEGTLKHVADGGIEEAGKKIFELAQTELVSLLPKIATQLAVLKITGAK